MSNLDADKVEGIAERESDFYWNASTTKSSARGVFQFTRATWLENCSDDFDDAWDATENIKCAVKLMSRGEWQRWSETLDECSCVKYVRSRGVNLPRGVDAWWYDTFPKKTPIEGGVIVFKYKDKNTGELVGHIAYIEKLEKDYILVSQANKKKCEVTWERIDYNDPHIVGFWHNF